MSSKFGLASQLTPTIGVSAQSYLNVFNNFRSDLEDFKLNRSLTKAEVSPSLSAIETYSGDQLSSSISQFMFNNSEDGTVLGLDTRLSNPVTLRSSVRNSIVNYNAFQKVFKPRLDEGRAHAHSSHFADLSVSQPFLFDRKVPYLGLLAKNTSSFFETPLY